MAHPQPIEARFLSEPLTWEQICERYPNEWVCLVEMEGLTEPDLDFRMARVVGHGKTRREPLDQARPFAEKYESMGHFHTSIRWTVRPAGQTV